MLESSYPGAPGTQFALQAVGGLGPRPAEARS